jgi:hypothetical protein
MAPSPVPHAAPWEDRGKETPGKDPSEVWWIAAGPQAPFFALVPIPPMPHIGNG